MQWADIASAKLGVYVAEVSMIEGKEWVDILIRNSAPDNTLLDSGDSKEKKNESGDKKAKVIVQTEFPLNFTTRPGGSGLGTPEALYTITDCGGTMKLVSVGYQDTPTDRQA